ncbi:MULTISPECIES: hypothetical protein [Paenibacillus]|uniref:hypothetical protein n=1 Tax=Paenibacillus TaxID=44249 RepID=UPI0015BA24F5|nr:hypothetical protein [Paenibacillus odorifer]
MNMSRWYRTMDESDSVVSDKRRAMIRWHQTAVDYDSVVSDTADLKCGIISNFG